MGEDVVSAGMRADLEVLKARKVDLSPRATAITKQIEAAIGAEGFLARNSHLIGFEQVVQALKMGLKLPSRETREDFFGDGHKLLVIDIPLLRHELANGMRAIRDFRSGRGETVDHLTLENYRAVTVDRMAAMMSEIKSDGVPFAGWQPIYRYEGGSEVIPPEQVPIIAPTVGLLRLAFDVPE